MCRRKDDTLAQVFGIQGAICIFQKVDSTLLVVPPAFEVEEAGCAVEEMLL